VAPPCTILYAEDEENDVYFLADAFEIVGSPHTLKVVRDGQEALDYLSGKGAFADRLLYPLPTLILLDINMPRESGLEVLEWLRQQPHLKSVPALMLTSSSRQEDMDKARLLGAADYLLKPSNPRRLIDLVKRLHDRWLS